MKLGPSLRAVRSLRLLATISNGLISAQEKYLKLPMLGSRLGKDELVKHFKEMTYAIEEYSAVCFNPARSGSKTTVETVMVGNCTQRMISA
ncbi:unnamed protein product [Thlaspi arvense]|uniref:Uncharacterized protein n=1 Tax=Thlaspi arvense TaxID=13288 RepID=A0AAU9RWF9_THLAR|nr:unnamed protein product [Thlaspi arvense]